MDGLDIRTAAKYISDAIRFLGLCIVRAAFLKSDIIGRSSFAMKWTGEEGKYE